MVLVKLDDCVAVGYGASHPLAPSTHFAIPSPQVDIIAPFMHLDIPAIGQSYLLFRARLAAPYTFSENGTSESLESRLVAPSDLPWSEIAFSSVQIALRAFCDDLSSGRHSYHHGTILKIPGSSPNDPMSFKLVDHIEMELTGPPTTQ